MSRPKPGSKPKKRSGCVPLLLVGICGFGIYSCTRDDENVEDNEVNYVNNGSSYQNNHYVPGVGYYHAPFGRWFPSRYNEHDQARGYFFNGSWNSSPHASNIVSSQPPSAEYSRVNNQWRAANPSEVASRKSTIARSRSTSRGGFGSFGRSSS